MAPAYSGVAARLIEPAWLRPKHSMSPRRDEEMTGTRVPGLPRQHRLALETDPNASSPPPAPSGTLPPASTRRYQEALRASPTSLSTPTARALKGRCEPPLRCGSRSASGRPSTALPLRRARVNPTGPDGPQPSRTKNLSGALDTMRSFRDERFRSGVRSLPGSTPHTVSMSRAWSATMLSRRWFSFSSSPERFASFAGTPP